MGNHGGSSLSAKRKGYLAKAKGAEIAPVNPPEPKMIICRRASGGPVEKEIAFESFRNDDCREGGCSRCLPSEVTQ